MDELTKLIAEKTGLSESQARQAAAVAIKFIKDKLPGPLAAQVDSVLSGGGAGDMMKNLGGLLGKD